MLIISSVLYTVNLGLNCADPLIHVDFFSVNMYTALHDACLAESTEKELQIQRVSSKVIHRFLTEGHHS